jgi:hypothetical protein
MVSASICFLTPQRERVRRIWLSRLLNVPVLHDARAVKPEEVGNGDRSLPRNVLAKVRETGVIVEALMDKGLLGCRQEVLESLDYLRARARHGIRVVLDPGLDAMIFQGGLHIVQIIELVHELVENGDLLLLRGGARGAVRCGGRDHADKSTDKNSELHDT